MIDKSPPTQTGEGDSLGVRRLHYSFAHVVVRDLFFENPAAFLAMFRAQKADAFLRHVWDEISRHVDEDDRFACDGLSCSFRGGEGGMHAGVARMPEATHSAEAILVAGVVRPRRRRFVFFRSPPQARYFTLERGFNLDDGSRQAVLCEWRARNHVNYGEVSGESEDECLDAIRGVLAGTRRARGATVRRRSRP